MSEHTPDRHLRARAVHRVTPEHVGQRVSIRHLVVTGHDTDPRATDVVGRLLGYEAGVLALVDRDAQLALVDEDAIVASRIVPPHPRLRPEPEHLGTVDHPLERDAARVLLLDADDRVLLVAHQAAVDRTVWTAPGGGLRRDEDHEAAAQRELHEELGFVARIGPWVWLREVRFEYAGVHLAQRERWFLTRIERWDPATAPLDDPGLLDVRWWSADELATTEALIAPHRLAQELAALLADGVPPDPVDVGR